MNSMRRRWERAAKRAIDVVGAGTVLVATAPLMAAVAAAVRLDIGAPVLFRQERPGLDCRPFTLVKFRTMREPKPGEDRYASDGDRLGAVGRFLRKTSLDELPTLLNVLVGDMSLVGPRPLLMEYLDRYTPEQRRRQTVPPGVTGLTAVRGRNALAWDDKFALDLYYVDHWSLWLDLQILFETVTLTIRGTGVSHGEHPTMPVFRSPAEPS